MCSQYYYWCKYLNAQVYCNGVCVGCIRNTDNFSNNYPQQFNYECPDCHGKFNYPSYKNDGTSVFIQRCPFCGRKMEGF